MSVFKGYDVVHGPNGTFMFDDGEVDHVTVRGPDGMRVMKPIKATDEEKKQAEIDALKRELDGVNFRLEHLDDPPLPWQDPPSPARVARERTSLVNTATVIVARLNELEPAAPARSRRK